MTIDEDEVRPGRDDSEGRGATPGTGGDAVREDEEIEPRDGATFAERLEEIAHLRGELERESARAAELRDQLVRTAADFDNFRKRTERDRVEERRQASASLVRSLLPVLDGLGRAIGSAASKAADNPELASFVDGMRMIEAQLLDVLKAAGLEPIDASGAFDPAHHEALMQEAVTDKPHMAILDVFEPGYRLAGRLIRPARVKVAFNPGAPAEPDSGDAQGEATGQGTAGEA